MDEMVAAAMAKWPNVPAVYGFLALSARGAWRLKGEPVQNAALAAFLARNYVCAAGGCYVQNGPQRVYVALERAPWLLRRLPGQWQVLPQHAQVVVTALFFTPEGEVYADCGGTLALLDDRDIAAVLAEGLPDWDGALASLPPACLIDGAGVALSWQTDAALLARFGVCLAPQPAAGSRAAVVSSGL